MPIKKDVSEVIKLCENLGLVVDPIGAGGHRKVRDPKSGAYVFGISSSPSDPNWRWMIMRHLRRLGLLRDGAYKTHKRGGGQVKRGKPAIDLIALKRAQDQAASNGQRIPLLEDLDDTTFFTRVADAYSEDGQQEAIDIMGARADAPRIRYIRQRLKKLLDEHGPELEAEARRKSPKLPQGRGAKAEFVRIAINEVAPKRDIRAWKSEASGQQTLSRFLEDDKGTVQVWAADLLDATMDHIEGLKWGEIDESKKRVTPPPERDIKLVEKTEKTWGAQDLLEKVEQSAQIVVIDNEPDYVDLPVTLEGNHIREKYADALLTVLKRDGSKTDEKILSRLDKLAGIV